MGREILLLDPPPPAFKILDSLAGEAAWKRRFAEKRDILCRLADEALEEDACGETRPLDDVLQSNFIQSRRP